jgi:hypothetical protein
MGINVLDNLSTQEVRLQAGTPLVAGDLVLNSDSGIAFAATPTLTIAQNNTTSTGPTAIAAVGSVQTGTNFGNTTMPWGATSCQLSNGSHALVYMGNGTTATTNVNVQFRNLSSITSGTLITIADTLVSVARIRRIDANSFVVAWQASAVIKFRIYTNDGTLVGSTVTVGTSASNDQFRAWNFNVLSNGNIVFSYDKVTSRDCETIIYNSVGTIVGTAITTEATASPEAIIVLPQISGGFVVYYRRGQATSAYKFARYNATGTLQGTLTTLVTNNNSLVGPIDDNVGIELSNGNFVLQAPNGANYPTPYVYSSTGTLIATVDISASVGTNYLAGYYAGICATSSGFATTGVNTTANNLLSTFNFSGGAIIIRRSITAQAGTNAVDAVGGIRLFNNGSLGFIAASSAYNSGCVASVDLRFFAFDFSGSLVGTAVVINNNSTTSSTFKNFYIASDGTFVLYYRFNSSVGYSFGTYTVRKKSIIGVAQEAAASGQFLRVGTLGSYTLSQVFPAGAGFDLRTNAVPGSRGTVAGGSAVLFGLG